MEGMLTLRRFLQDESGLTLVEYVMIATAIALGIFTAVNLLGPSSPGPPPRSNEKHAAQDAVTRDITNPPVLGVSSWHGAFERECTELGCGPAV